MQCNNKIVNVNVKDIIVNKLEPPVIVSVIIIVDNHFHIQQPYCDTDASLLLNDIVTNHSNIFS